MIEAERGVRRLAPDSFPEVPEALRRHLDWIGCQIPQTWFEYEPHNLISGEFQRPGQTDWAALCEIGGKTAVKVFPGGDPRRVETLFESDVASYLQVVLPDGTLGFSHAITTVGREYMLERLALFGNAASGDKIPPVIDHQGIAVAVAEKGSTVFYWFEGKWLELPGSD